MRVKKSGVIILMLALASWLVSAQSFIPCSPQGPPCPQGETCQYYEGEGYLCGNGGNGPQLTCDDFGLVPLPPPSQCRDSPPCFITNGVPPCTAGETCCITGETSFFDILLGFDVAENLLKEKLLFTLHIVKEQLFQTEVKIIETSLSQNQCNEQPVSFAVSKKDFRYGKLEEIDAIINKLILVLGKDPVKYGINEEKLELAAELENKGEELISEAPRAAFNCKFWAYQSLLGRPTNVGDPNCECPLEECERPFTQCDGECVALESDPNNCGTCRHVCDPGHTCINGNCVFD